MAASYARGRNANVLYALRLLNSGYSLPYKRMLAFTELIYADMVELVDTPS
jgi:hypothetical protein